MGARLWDVVILALLFICSTQAVMKVNLAQLMQNQRLSHQFNKRGQHHKIRLDDQNDENAIGGNPCEDYPDHPFPCKTTKQCLPFRYICDKNFDCEDGSDENIKMCTASKRPPIDEIKEFLEKEEKWLIPNFFPGKKIKTIASGLAVSPSVEDLRYFLNWDEDETDNFRMFLQAVSENRDEDFQQLGMPKGDWPEVSYIFTNLMESGFDPYF